MPNVDPAYISLTSNAGTRSPDDRRIPRSGQLLIGHDDPEMMRQLRRSGYSTYSIADAREELGVPTLDEMLAVTGPLAEMNPLDDGISVRSGRTYASRMHSRCPGRIDIVRGWWLGCEGSIGHTHKHYSRDQYSYGPTTGIEWGLVELEADDDHPRRCACCRHEYWGAGISPLEHRGGPNDVLCVDCAQNLPTCHTCDHIVGTSYAAGIRIEDSDGYPYTYCGECSQDISWGRCDACADRVETEAFSYAEYGMCQSCADSRDDDDDYEDSGYPIRSYSYRPDPVFYGDDPHGLYLGWELETEVSRGYGGLSEVASTILEVTGDRVYVKEDSSIDRGFELVSHPMSHEYARDAFPWKMLNTMSSLGCSPDSDSNGMHVHVSRAGFSGPLHIYRWIKFMHRNSKHVGTVARRDSTQWADWNSDVRDNAKHHAKGARDGRRYSAINVQNDHTFEVRVFAASLDRLEIMAALDLVAGSVEYTRQLTAHSVAARGGWTWYAFRQWLGTGENALRYAALIEFLGDRESPEEDPPPPAVPVDVAQTVLPIPSVDINDLVATYTSTPGGLTLSQFLNIL